ncbi:MAG TPA: alkaline phosphatase family protein [Solirubrobacteraceae bacterium]|nr:alkaline phosphatase family protein [Solirubrobacteraceae bacterium]
MLDGFGLEFLERHRDHPLVRRLDVTPLTTQFPSTTTAHLTTLHFGLPVAQHGLYEWNIFEPALGEIICPLRFTRAASRIEGELAGELDPGALAPGPTMYEQLDAPTLVMHPEWIVGSSFTRLATRGAEVAGFATLPEGVAALADRLDRPTAPAYALLYWDLIDRTGHEHGPSSPEFHAAGRAALDAVWDGCERLRGCTVLFTADHGQVDVSPERVDYLDVVWPQLPELLSQPRPAGSSRDVFLHVADGRIPEVIEGLAARLGARAEVHPAADLFPDAGPRLRARLGDVAVLPAAGRQAWLHAAAANERWWRGQHGGRSPAETATYLAELR